MLFRAWNIAVSASEVCDKAIGRLEGDDGLLVHANERCERVNAG